MKWRRLARLPVTLAACLPAACSEGVLAPAGPVGADERTILLNSLAIMLAVVIPTISATLFAAWWFRKGNRRAEHRPDWAFSGQLELVVWAIPAMVVLLLSSIAWIGSHQLDPPRPLASKTPPVDVEVVSLDWKWLFIYPAQGVATVNRLVIPAGTPVRFRLTSASVMNSFFVPRLGSQIYTMAGMTTRLNLQADKPGRFMGQSAHYSGEGFSDMKFEVEALPAANWTAWAAGARGQGGALDAGAYQRLAQRGVVKTPIAYGAVNAGLFDEVVRLSAPAAGLPHTVGKSRGEG